jgi:hypothetical protein
VACPMSTPITTVAWPTSTSRTGRTGEWPLPTPTGARAPSRPAFRPVTSWCSAWTAASPSPDGFRPLPTAPSVLPATTRPDATARARLP